MRATAFFLSILFFMGQLAWAKTDSALCDRYATDPVFAIKYAHLSRFDEKAWLELVDEVARQSIGYELFLSLLPLEMKMPDGLKRKLEYRIHNYYAKAEKGPINPSIFHFIAPKRALDTLITNLDHPFYWFENPVREGRKLSPEEVYQEYLRELHGRIFEGSTTHGQYSGDIALKLYRNFQKTLREWRARNPDKMSPKIYVTGSFPNGRANLTFSDIDTAIYPWDYGLQEELLKTLQETFAHVDGLGLYLSWFTFGSPGHLQWASMMNPINVRITPDEMEFWVFPPLQDVPHAVYNFGTDVRPEIYPITALQ